MKPKWKTSRDWDNEIFHKPALAATEEATQLGVSEEIIRQAMDRHNEMCRERGISAL